MGFSLNQTPSFEMLFMHFLCIVILATHFYERKVGHTANTLYKPYMREAHGQKSTVA